jgi:hypothetical protein
MNNSALTREYILKENVLTDNLLILAPKNHVFKGGYIAKVKEYTYQNAWNDKEQVKRFRSKKALSRYINKRYPEFQHTYDIELF